jgi:hypothetical protein
MKFTIYTLHPDSLEVKAIMAYMDWQLHHCAVVKSGECLKRSNGKDFVGVVLDNTDEYIGKFFDLIKWMDDRGMRLC